MFVVVLNVGRHFEDCNLSWGVVIRFEVLGSCGRVWFVYFVVLLFRDCDHDVVVVLVWL